MISKVVIRHNFPENANRENDGRLRNFITIREGKRYSNELADDTIRTLWESGLIDDARLLAEEDGQSVRIFVEVEERQRCGPRPSVMGNTVFSDQKLFRSIQPTLALPITELHAEAAREKLEQFYRQHGYKHVSITIDYEHWGKRSVQDFVLVIQEGPRTPPWYEGLFQPPGKATAS